MSDEPDFQRLNELVREALGDNADKPFRPFAIYDGQLDRILVQIRDCSVTEKSINEVLTLLEDNYPEDSEDRYAGLAVECARQFLIKHRFPYRGQIDPADIIDAIFIIYPCPVRIQDEIYLILVQAPVFIDLPG